LSHIASTYAAILAVVNIGTEEAYKMVDVERMRRFLKSMKNNLKYENEGQTSGWNLIDPSTG
jgi:prenyltransferase beta subunit